jgi:hypothetical protein
MYFIFICLLKFRTLRIDPARVTSSDRSMRHSRKLQDTLLVAHFERVVRHESVHLLRRVEGVPEEELVGIIARQG